MGMPAPIDGLNNRIDRFFDLIKVENMYSQGVYFLGGRNSDPNLSIHAMFHAELESDIESLPKPFQCTKRSDFMFVELFYIC